MPITVRQLWQSPGNRQASPGFIDSQPGMPYSGFAGTVRGAATLLRTTEPPSMGVMPVSRAESLGADVVLPAHH
jgi:hypothetical protein